MSIVTGLVTCTSAGEVRMMTSGIGMITSGKHVREINTPLYPTFI